mgnify:CR=1 FL=1
MREELEKDALVLDVLGEHVARQYVKGKLKEWNEYQTRVSSWELERDLNIVVAQPLHFGKAHG